MDGSHIDNAAPRAFVHAWQSRLRQQERRGEENLEQLPPLGFGELVYRRHMLNPSVIDQDVKPTEGGYGVLNNARRAAGLVSAD